MQYKYASTERVTAKSFCYRGKEAWIELLASPASDGRGDTSSKIEARLLLHPQEFIVLPIYLPCSPNSYRTNSSGTWLPYQLVRR
jgi:hypothetical protein